jgi:DNA end-binding protein Ku
MAARAMWSGTVKIGSSGLPVKLYSAVEDQSIHFHILDAKTKSRVKQQMVNPETGEEVAREDIRKGYEVERGTFILLEDEELKTLEPKPSKEIEITRFVPAGHISHLWYDRPYYLGPDGDSEDYFAFAQALKNEGKEAVARWVMRGKSYVGALRINGDYLVLITLHHADEVMSDRDLPAPHARGLSEKESKMAHELVAALEGELHFEQFRDEYRDRVLKFIEAKARGHKPRLRAGRAKRATTSLESSLAKSLAAMKKERKKEKEVA